MTGHLTRAVHFSASHHYQRPEWSDEENRRRFGSDALRQEHGHDYRCEVTVRGSIDPETGMVIELGLLDEILRREVIARFHGCHINRDVEGFGPGGAQPTTENLAAYIMKKVAAQMPNGVEVYCVGVKEDRDLWSDAYAGEIPR